MEVQSPLKIPILRSKDVKIPSKRGTTIKDDIEKQEKYIGGARNLKAQFHDGEFSPDDASRSLRTHINEACE